MLPGEPGLTRAPLAQDQMALEIASHDDDVLKVARNRGDVLRLWECCQIPDYRKLSPSAHSELVLSVYRFVVRAGRIPDDWFARHLDQLDKVDGEIDTLSARIAQVRTWTFIANRPDWLRDPEHWQGVTRRVEDTLSDALHQRLAQRFVDRRTSVLRRRLRENAIMEAEITSSGDVMVEGQHVGQLNGFRFTSDPQAAGEEAKTLNAAAQKALASEIEGRATRVSEAVDEAFVLANDGQIRWLGEPVGRIVAGAHILEPQVRVIADEQLTGPALELVQRRVDLWLAQHVKKLLGSLVDLEKSEGVDGIARGIAFQIAEALGVLERAKVADEVKNLPQEARGALRKMGVRFGAYHLYLPALVKPAPRALAAQLWALKNGGVEGVKGLDEVPHLASSGRTSFVADQAVPKGFYRAAGFRVCGERAVRVDILERLADLIRPAIAYRPGTTAGDPPAGTADHDGFVVTVGMTSLAGCSGEAFGSILKSLGYVVDRRVGPPITVPLVPKAATEPLAPPTVGNTPESADVATDETRDETIAPDAPAESDPTVVVAEPAADDLASRVSLAREDELIAAALEGGSLEAIETPPMDEHSAPLETAPAPADDAHHTAEAPIEPAADAVSGDPDLVEPETPAAVAEVSTDQAEAMPEASAEPVEIPLIEVWRPHRHNVHNRRPAADRNRGPRRPNVSAPAQTTAAAQDAPATDLPVGEGERPPRPEGQNRPGNRFRDFKRPAGGGSSGGGDARSGTETRRGAEGRGSESRGGSRGPGGEGRRDGPGKGRGDDRRDRGERTPSFQTTEKPKPKDRVPDPNSPFAKLAALKALLEKDGK